MHEGVPRRQPLEATAWLSPRLAAHTWTGETSRRMLEMLPGGRMINIPGGHLCHMVSPKEFSNTAIEFLKD